MAGLLQGQASIITGGSQGIGKAIAGAFLDEGADCLLVARSPDSLQLALRELSRIGPRVLAFRADVGSTDPRERLRGSMCPLGNSGAATSGGPSRAAQPQRAPDTWFLLEVDDHLGE